MSDIEEKINQIQELIKQHQSIPFSLITDRQVLDSLSEDKLFKL